MRDKILDYLIRSGFIDFYTKKLMFPSDIDSLYDDYVQEVWLQICEVPEEKWEKLYHPERQDPFYEVRNWVSVLVRNTVRSTTSSAYRKLKKQSTVAENLGYEEWTCLANTVEDNITVFK